jgi:minor histocompatibility antigen H13
MAEAPPAASAQSPTNTTSVPNEDSLPSLLVAYAAIVTMAVVPIYIGAWLSLYRKHAPKEADEPKEETMTAKDAYMFPIMGSAVLFSLYLLFKFLDKDLVNLLLTFYFLFFGFFAVSQTLALPIRRAFPSLSASKSKYTFTIPLMSEPTTIDVDGADLVSMGISVFILIWYVRSKSWLANNLLGLCFSVQGVSMINIGSFQIGAILLSGLFFYDIWWVFFTEVMVTVAKSFDAPIKLLFPKNMLLAIGSENTPFQFSMLGLGDIVIPGIFIALLLRYDAHRAHGSKRVVGKNNTVMNPHVESGVFARPYFAWTLVAYTLGLITTIFVMHVFKAAQPALLYLVPACLGAALITALTQSDLSHLFTYQDVQEEEEEGGDGKKDKKEKKEEKLSTKNKKKKD